MKRITLTLPAPYVGLRPFEEKDALLFFGREAHVRDLLAKLEHQQRFIAVIGASGSGKSSLVRAGLIPALHRGALASAGYRWNVHIIKPGDAPLHNLVEKLTDDPRWIDGGDRTASMASLRAQFTINPLALVEQYQRRAALFNGEALLLVVDQFEEIFRYRQQNIDEAEAFIKLLLRSVSESGQVPVYVVITMRSDFLGNCVSFFGLPEAINNGLYLTPRLRPEQLKSIIASPLALIGSDIDPVLVNRMINTLESDDELPILEHALLRMWNHAKDEGRNYIEAQDFATICKSHDDEDDATTPKLAFAIDNHASEIYNQFTPQQKKLAQQLFPALVERRESRDVRRPQTLWQLIELAGESNKDDVLAVINAYRKEGAGFLSPPIAGNNIDIAADELIDISHESFFRQWKLYRQWLDEEAFDAAELKEWCARLRRHWHTGESWLDDNDCHRASEWLERINKYQVPQQWATRYLGQHDFQSIKTFIQNSQRIVQEKQQAETKRLEAEAAWQRKLAEHAEQQKQQAEAFAQSSRIKSYWAIGAALVAILLSVISFSLWQQAEKEKIRADGEKNRATHARKHAEQLARNAHADALIATAENLFNSNRDQSVLLVLSARHISSTQKVEAHLRYTLNHLGYLHNLRGHEAQVINAQFSPDGKSIVTASDDNTVRLWDAVNGKELAVLRGHGIAISNAQFTPDGKSIVIASWDTVRLWDAASRKELAVLRGHENNVVNIQFSPDGKSIITASKDKTARLWNPASGKELAVLRGHEDRINNAQFAPDGKSIVTASDDKTVRLWDAVNGKELAVLRGHEAEVVNAQFAPDGNSIVTASWDGTARLWDATSGEELAVLRGHESLVNSAQFSPNGKSIVTASGDKTVRLWDAASGKELAVLHGHENDVVNIQFSPDGKSIVSASKDKTARLWDAASGKELAVLRGHEAQVNNAQFSPDGKSIVTASDDKSARLWYAASGKELAVLRGHEAQVNNAQFAPDGHSIVTASGDGTARLWDAASGKELAVLRGHENNVVNIQFSPDGKSIITASKDKTARLWDPASGKELAVLRGHEDRINNAQFAPDGKSIVTASDDKTARLWDAVNGKELAVLYSHEAPVINAQFSPDGKSIVTASWDYTTRLWDAASGQELAVLSGHEAQVINAQFSPDGKSIITASKDKTARLWDPASGKELAVLRGHEDRINNAQFAPDGKSIVTASDDKTARLWDVVNGKELAVLYGHENDVVNAQFSPDGKSIITASKDKTARLWDAVSGKELAVLRGHKYSVFSSQFAPDGQSIVTASEDKTARLWLCNVCRPIEEIVAELKRRIGRDLTDEERRRFGVADIIAQEQ